MKKIYLVEDEKSVIALLSYFNKNKIVEIEIIPFRELQLLNHEFEPENFQIIVDISRNANYLLVCNRLKKIFAEKIIYIYLIVNRKQIANLKKDADLMNNLLLLLKPDDMMKIIKIAEV